MFDYVAQFVVRVNNEFGEKLVPTLEVPIKGGTSHIHLSGDFPQGEIIGALL